MPTPFDPYSEPEMILALYQDPESEVLLAEYALSTGGVQMGAISQGAGASSSSGGGLLVTDIQGAAGNGEGQQDGRHGGIDPILTGY